MLRHFPSGIKVFGILKKSIYVGVFETSIFVHQWHINWKDCQVDPIGRARSYLPSGDKQTVVNNLGFILCLNLPVFLAPHDVCQAIAFTKNCNLRHHIRRKRHVLTLHKTRFCTKETKNVSSTGKNVLVKYVKARLRENEKI